MSAIDTLLANYPAGSKIDTDGFPKDQPYQCFDVAVVYARLVANKPSLYINCKSSGYVKDWWNDFATNGLSQWFDQIPWNQQGQRGDIAIWGNAPATPLSHIAIVLADNGNTQNIYGQNQPNPYTTIINFTSNGLLGYLRPKGGNTVATILNNDDWRNRCRRSFLNIRGRDMAEVEFQNYVGQDFLTLIEALEDNAEADANIQFAGLGRQANAENWGGKITDLTNANNDKTNTINDISSQLAVARAALKTAQNDDTVDKATIASLQTTVDELNKKLESAGANDNTGAAGTKPTDPVQTPGWFVSFVNTLAQKLSEIFTKGK